MSFKIGAVRAAHFAWCFLLLERGIIKPSNLSVGIKIGHPLAAIGLGLQTSLPPWV
jgi:hypothetical protein